MTLIRENPVWWGIAGLMVADVAAIVVGLVGGRD